jgi:hypothetical protein
MPQPSWMWSCLAGTILVPGDDFSIAGEDNLRKHESEFG